MTTRTIKVDLAGRAYNIAIGPGLIDRLGELAQPLLARPKVVIVTDETVAPLYGTRAFNAFKSAGIDAALVLTGESTWEMIQGLAPEHRPTYVLAGVGDLLDAVVAGDIAALAPAEADRRRTLGLPPYRAMALVEGQGATEFVNSTGLESASIDERSLVRHDDWMTLGAALVSAPRPKGSRLRIEVDPPRV